MEKLQAEVRDGNELVEKLEEALKTALVERDELAKELIDINGQVSIYNIISISFIINQFYVYVCIYIYVCIHI